jgi:hypothetical protein
VEHRQVIGNAVIGYSFLLWNNNTLAFQMGNAGNGNWVNFNTSPLLTVPADGRWHFVAVTVNRSSPTGITFYLDKLPPEYASPIPYSGTVTPPSTIPLRVGGSATGGFFKGCIDEVELFNRELAPAEITALYNARRAGKCKPSCPFCPIPIGIIQAGTNIVITWPVEATNFNPEEATNLQGTNSVWTTVTNAPIIVGGNNQITLPSSQPRRFFRLRGPGTP